MKNDYNKPKKSIFPQGIDHVLRKAAFENNMKGLPRRWKLFTVWSKVVGPALADKTEPLSIRDNVILVKVSDPTWAHELTYLKEEMLDKLNREMKGKTITDIRFITGSVRPVDIKRRTRAKVSAIEIDPEKVTRSMDEKALRGKGKLKKLFKEVIKSSFRLRKYLDEQSASQEK